MVTLLNIVIPGFINTHVHHGFSEDNLKAWAAGGVTTVRDESLGDIQNIEEKLTWRQGIKDNPIYARLISAGQMIAVPGGYGSLIINSPEEARQAVLNELDLGFEQIKVALEDGYAGESGLPKLTPEELAAIVETAHQAGARVSGHITESAYIPAMLDAGVDDIAHSAYDLISFDVLQRMVDQGVILIPTFTIFRNYDGSVEGCVINLKNFVNAGGVVALGNDFDGGPGEFELGIPMFEIEMMTAAKMTPMQIITASTLNAAHVSNLEQDLGSLEPGKIADILIINAFFMGDFARSRILFPVPVTKKNLPDSSLYFFFRSKTGNSERSPNSFSATISLMFTEIFPAFFSAHPFCHK
ncbi:MAG: amidohydrolase family protein [Bacteroidales bacterium]|nr:amidohydrolase family protein [Bacteroidales bacterium]